VADPQRTHPATPKRVKDFRKRGEIALSRDAVSAAALAGGVIALMACVGAAGNSIMQLTRDAANAADGRDPVGLSGAAAATFKSAAMPVLIGASIAAIVAMAVQLGWPPAFKKIAFDFSKLSPASNLMSTFSLGAMTRRTGSALVKLIVVSAIVMFSIRGAIATETVDAGGIGAYAWHAVSRVLWVVLGALGVLGAVDFFLAKRRLSTKMKMTAEEVKREHRESEGDPHVKGRRRQRMRELAKRRLVQAVETADVIVVNPTHYAVALRYDDKQDRAPVVVAKGTDEVAEKIREVARQKGVPILARPPLARALHKHVKEGHPIPVNLFKAVAEVLAYVYKLRRAS
jgi:flagellar biosynthetic protein FlhB